MNRLFLMIYPGVRAIREGSGRERNIVLGTALTNSHHGYIRFNREPQPGRSIGLIYRMSPLSLSTTFFTPSHRPPWSLRLLSFSSSDLGAAPFYTTYHVVRSWHELTSRPTNTVKIDLDSTRKQQSTLNRYVIFILLSSSSSLARTRTELIGQYAS